MFNAFIDDKSGFKNGVILLILISLLFLGGMFVLLNRYNVIVAQSAKDNVAFEAQSVWLKKYDADTVKEIEKLVLLPCKESEVDKVQKEQLQLFAKQGIKVSTVRKANMTKSAKAAKNALKGAKTSLSFEGSWENIVALLNEFEKQHSLVAITDLSLSSADGIHGRMDYVIYYR